MRLSFVSRPDRPLWATLLSRDAEPCWQRAQRRARSPKQKSDDAPRRT